MNLAKLAGRTFIGLAVSITDTAMKKRNKSTRNAAQENLLCLPCMALRMITDYDWKDIEGRGMLNLYGHHQTIAAGQRLNTEGIFSNPGSSVFQAWNSREKKNAFLVVVFSPAALWKSRESQLLTGGSSAPPPQKKQKMKRVYRYEIYVCLITSKGSRELFSIPANAKYQVSLEDAKFFHQAYRAAVKQYETDKVCSPAILRVKRRRIRVEVHGQR